MSRTVLVVDDKETLRDSVAMTLQRSGMTVLAAADGASALETIAKKRPDAVVTDLRMPGMSGLELIEQMNQIDEDLPVVLMTAFGTIDTAVRAIKLGAFDYITKPFEGDELIIAVKRAIEHSKLKKENAVLKLTVPCGSDRPVMAGADAGGLSGLARIIGSSSAMRQVKDDIMAVARSHGTVLLCGESGTGKEVVARAIHEMSPRAEEAFLGVNCAAMSESLLESELFGHERGAFTGADKLRKGRFELAHGGTLLLDEISEVQPQVQAKLLRVLQERMFERVGSSTTMGVDVRVVATTNRDLASEVDQGTFRQDLFYRLNVLPIVLPALRERVEDVCELAPHFVSMIAAREGREAPRISEEAMGLMLAYAWPGNVRELQNCCERAVVLCEGDVIEAENLAGWLTRNAEPMPAAPKVQPPLTEPKHLRHAPVMPPVTVRSVSMGSTTRENESQFAMVPSAESLESASTGAVGGIAESGGGDGLNYMVDEPRPLEEIEREVIVRTLQRYNGHRQKTAASLGIGVRTLGLKLKKWKEQELVPTSL